MPVLVTEHGIAHDRRHAARRLHRAVARRSARRDRRRCPRARLPPLDVDRQLRVDLRVRAAARAHGRRPHDVRADPKPSADVYERIVRANAVDALTPPCASHCDDLDRAVRGRPSRRPASGPRTGCAASSTLPTTGTGARCGSAPAGWSRSSSTARGSATNCCPATCSTTSGCRCAHTTSATTSARGANAIAIVLADGWFRGQTGAVARRRSVGATRPRCGPTLVVDGRGGRGHRRVVAQRAVAHRSPPT